MNEWGLLQTAHSHAEMKASESKWDWSVWWHTVAIRIQSSNRAALCSLVTHHCNSPMNLSIFMQVLQRLQYFFQDGGDAGFIQYSRLVLATRDDMFDDV